MANLFDLIFNRQQAQPQQYGNIETVLQQPMPQTQELQIVDNNGNATVKPNPTFFNRLTGIGDRVTDGLFGKVVEPQVDMTGDTPQATISNERQGGLLNDIAAGFRDNAQNGFSVNNLMPDKEKSIANRIGEGFGTAARFLNSPLGRSILVGGAVAATGGNPLQVLAYGSQTGAMNQNNVMKDRAYRERLQAMGIDTNNIGGYITDDAYKQIIDAKQLEEQQAYREMVLNNQIAQNEALNGLRRDQFAYQKQKDATDNAYKQANLDLGYAKLAADMQKENNKNNKTDDLAEIEAQLQAFEAMFDKVPNKLRGATTGAARRMVGLASTNEANFDAQRTLLFNQIARKLGGEKGVLSDQDIKRIEKALPTLSDSYEQRKAKMAAVYNLLDIKKGNVGNVKMGNVQPKTNALPDPLGIR